MSRQLSLRPLDIPVALRIVEEPDVTYQQLRDDLGISGSTAHDAVKRMTIAGLVYSHKRQVNRSALLEFLEHGVRYAFPPIVGERIVRGVPTAHASPALSHEFGQSDPFVWPSPSGTVTGESVEPLYDRAVELPERCPSVYEALTLVDAIRVGRARERKIAVERLRERMGYHRSAAAACTAPPEQPAGEGPGEGRAPLLGGTGTKSLSDLPTLRLAPSS